jgi:NagD protein
MMRVARKELGLATSETIMVGDTMETDILGGVQMGYHTVLVLSGGTQLSDLSKFAYRPHQVINSIADLCESPNVFNKVFPPLSLEDTSLDLNEWLQASS